MSTDSGSDIEGAVQKPFFGPESPMLDPPARPNIKPWRSVAKAVSWRTVGTIDTLILPIPVDHISRPDVRRACRTGRRPPDCELHRDYRGRDEIHPLLSALTGVVAHRLGNSVPQISTSRDDEPDDDENRSLAYDRIRRHLCPCVVLHWKRGDSSFDWWLGSVHQAGTLLLARKNLGSAGVRSRTSEVITASTSIVQIVCCPPHNQTFDDRDEPPGSGPAALQRMVPKPDRQLTTHVWTALRWQGVY